MFVQSNAFSPFVRILARGKQGSRSLNQDEAREAMTLILQGECLPEQLGAFLMLLRVQEESPEEMAGFVAACRDVISAPNIEVDLDWSSYAGKRRHLPWFLLAALGLAEKGIRIFMHGTGGHMPDRLYSADVLQQLGITVCTDWTQVTQQLDIYNFAYMPLGAFCPELERIIQMRPIFGVRSPVNSFTRMINPLGAKRSFHAIFHPPYLARHQQASALLGDESVYIIKGDGGEIERNPDRSTQVAIAQQGMTSELRWPALLHKRVTNEEDMQVDILKQVWQGALAHEYGTLSVIATMAIALHQLGHASTPEEADKLAAHWWQDRNKTRFD